jgi:hypothetical protein
MTNCSSKAVVEPMIVCCDTTTGWARLRAAHANLSSVRTLQLVRAPAPEAQRTWTERVTRSSSGIDTTRKSESPAAVAAYARA